MPEVETTPADTNRTALAPATHAPGEGPDPLASLKKMSTTAGIGFGSEYVAVNPVAVAALLLGVASLLVIFGDVLLVIPAAGIACAIIALRQIANSNGTQTGRLLAVAGLVLSVLLGVGRLGWRAFGGWTSRADKAEVSRLVSKLGEHLSHEEYPAAYALFSQRFKDRVSQQRFTDTYRNMNALPAGGGIKEMRWNELVEFEDEPQAAARNAYTMAFLYFRKIPDPGRQTVHLRKEGGNWLIEDVPALFPREKKPGAGGAAGGPAGSREGPTP